VARKLLLQIVFAGILLSLSTAAAAQTADEYHSPLALAASPDGASIYVAESGARQIVRLDPSANTVSPLITLPESPSGLVVSPDGKTLYVTCGSAAGKVCVVDIAGGALTATLNAGHTPCAPVLSPDAAVLYVCNRFNNDVSVLDLASGQEAARIPVLREPVAAALTADGRFLLVNNLIPSGASDGDYVAASVSIIDTGARQVASQVRLPNGSTALRGLCLSPDGQFAYVTHILARYLLPTTQLERGWMNTNAVSVLDVAQQKLVNTVLLDSVDLGAANPWGVGCSADGQWLCVAHSGTHELSVIDRPALHAKLAKVAAGEKVSEVSATPEDVPNDLAFLVGLQRRIPLTGNGPRGIAVLGDKAYAAEYFSDSVGVAGLAVGGRPEVRSVPLGPERPISTVRLGEKLFHDASMCFQKWQSCATCHPEARIDGLNWDLMNDGLGNPKNTKSMLLAHQTPPAMSSGIRDHAETAVRSGIKFIQFVVRPESDAAAIDEYLKALPPIPSPFLVNGQRSESAERGAKVFEQAGCATCHPAPLYTDLKPYLVGTGKDRESDLAFDTPTLIEIWRTAPYLHDGRAASLREVLTQHNAGDQHGVTSTLLSEQMDDLTNFLLSL
jgi:YVTN family beta-propeller protein